jgi:uncharacterized membrane protein YfcA
MNGPDLPMIDLSLFLAGFVCWTISTLSAGGGSVLIVAAITTLLPGHAIAPVVTMASIIGSPTRAILFARFIDWRVVRWYLPGATIGAIVGGLVFARAGNHLIQTFVGLFLISTVLQYRMGNRARSFQMRLAWFPPVSFVSGMTSAIVGASGLLANPFYLNYGMEKEAMLATRAVNSLAIQAVKIATYLAFGVLNWDLARHGLAAGSGAALAILVTRPWLRHLDGRRFRQFAVLVMLIAGLGVLWQQRIWLLRLVTG